MAPSMAQDSAHWKLHGLPWSKLNVDGMIFTNSQLASVGAVIRNDARRITVTLCKHLLLPLGPLKAEAKALEEGIFFAWDVGIQEVIL